jgi:vacuolar-type H+-ATPase subunit I/STV1
MGGLATAAVGAITGGWFGIDPGIMPAWLRGMIVMNPLREPMKMLNVVFILGIVQILTGLAIKMVAELREGRWLDAILDQFVWIVFIVFLVPLGYNWEARSPRASWTSVRRRRWAPGWSLWRRALGRTRILS